MKENLQHNTKEHEINRREFIKNAFISLSIGAAMGTILAMVEKMLLSNTIQNYLNNLNNPKLKSEILELDAHIKKNLENHKKIYKKLNGAIDQIEKNIDKIKINDELKYLNHLENINEKLTSLSFTYEDLNRQIEIKLEEINSIKTNDQEIKRANLAISNYLLKQKIEIQKIKLLNLNLQLQISDIIKIILQRKEDYISKRAV
jgi:hypothetical protein